MAHELKVWHTLSSCVEIRLVSGSLAFSYPPIMFLVPGSIKEKYQNTLHVNPEQVVWGLSRRILMKLYLTESIQNGEKEEELRVTVFTKIEHA